MVQNEWSVGLNDSTLVKINLVRGCIFSFNSLSAIALYGLDL